LKTANIFFSDNAVNGLFLFFPGKAGISSTNEGEVIPVILQKIKTKGFDGEITIVRSLLRELRGRSGCREPFIRVESEPGQQMQVDWGHFQSLKYGEQPRKLYALAIIESHSRMLYVFFSHSQKQEYLHMGLMAAFHYFGGCPQELVVDNMMTAVTERAGSVIRFNESFLDFLRPFRITPRACNVRAPHEKGKIENAHAVRPANGTPYLRTNPDRKKGNNLSDLAK